MNVESFELSVKSSVLSEFRFREVECFS